jgi:hypothetical protein
MEVFLDSIHLLYFNKITFRKLNLLPSAGTKEKDRNPRCRARLRPATSCYVTVCFIFTLFLFYFIITSLAETYRLYFCRTVFGIQPPSKSNAKCSSHLQSYIVECVRVRCASLCCHIAHELKYRGMKIVFSSHSSIFRFMSNVLVKRYTLHLYTCVCVCECVNMCVYLFNHILLPSLLRLISANRKFGYQQKTIELKSLF